MAISQTKIKNKLRRKTNPELVETISSARKADSWVNIAHKVSGPTRSHSAVNLDTIDSQTKAGDTVLIPGKVLSQGNLTKKIKIVALSASNLALEKIKNSKSEFTTILEEIRKNPKAEGIKIIQ